jgi:hypothetical protein
LFILGELSCRLIFGRSKSDPRLITLGVTGVVASALIHWTQQTEPLLGPDIGVQHGGRCAGEVARSRIHAEQAAQVQPGADER